MEQVAVVGAVNPVLPAEEMVREAVGIFPDERSLTDAIDALLLAGFARCQVGLLAHADTAKRAPGLVLPLELLAEEAATRRSGWFCPEALGNAEGSLVSGFTIVPMFGTAWAMAAAGGTLAATTALAVGTGGLGAAVGAALAFWLSRHHAAHVRQQVEAGGLLLWIRTTTPALEERAMAILAGHGARDVHVHGGGMPQRPAPVTDGVQHG